MNTVPLIVALMVGAAVIVLDILNSDHAIESATNMDVWREGNRQIRFVLVVKGAIAMMCIGSATMLAVIS